MTGNGPSEPEFTRQTTEGIPGKGEKCEQNAEGILFSKFDNSIHGILLHLTGSFSVKPSEKNRCCKGI